ncbi:MAG: ABC transporter substrate-binding protein, partial [Gaiellaceae bacterium]
VGSGADAVYLVGHQEADPAGRDAGVAPLLKALREGGFQGPLIGSFAQQTGLLLEKAPSAVEGMYFTSTRLPPEALPPEAARLGRRLELEGRYALDAVYGWAAANVVLDAIAASDGTRAGVRAALFTVTRDGVLGSYRVDDNGDIRPQRVAIFQARGGRLLYRQSMTVGSAG